MLKLLVIADDFTGALDTGVQFLKQGIQTLVSTETVVQYDALPQEIEVLVLIPRVDI
ncbi:MULTISPECIES: four-carbon acid sugar kinase family protein [Enterococcus]|uniref:four-carbon acid sugar kinase family protein n=1 Tax=Enterococcus TaxID=1350 RepID=UPI0022EBC952|nr:MULTISPECIES: four-carbon acid sugar kinase family protein [Enterococcus]